MYNPVIFGLAGLTVSNEERELFLKTRPFGFILFKRNCASREQITTLTSSLKALFSTRKVEIFIDQVFDEDDEVIAERVYLCLKDDKGVFGKLDNKTIQNMTFEYLFHMLGMYATALENEDE